MTRLMLSALLILFLPSYSLSESKSVAKPFLSESSKKLLNDPDILIYAKLLGKMRMYPSADPLIGPPRDYVLLSKSQKEKVVSFLTKSVEIDPESRVKECVYKPGIAFTLMNKRTDAFGPHRYLLCFNCNLWAAAQYTDLRSALFDKVLKTETPIAHELNHDGSYAEDIELRGEVVGFGDFKPDRIELEKLAKEIFGDEFP